MASYEWGRETAPRERLLQGDRSVPVPESLAMARRQGALEHWKLGAVLLPVRQRG